jgi:protein subunit release factor B
VNSLTFGLSPMMNLSRRLFAAASSSRPPATPVVIDFERDVRKSFSRSSGPGGQNVNKRATKARLVHEPTGIAAVSQVHRSAHSNLLQARKLLADQVDREINGANSKFALKVAKLQRQKETRRRRAAKKYGAPADSQRAATD